MIYGDKLRESLQNEQNPINKMYLNEILINWTKVENTMEESSDSPLSTMVSVISQFTKSLRHPKFEYNSSKNCGFSTDHVIFSSYYLYDLLDLVLATAGITDDGKGVLIKQRNFCTGIQLQQNTYTYHTEKPYLELSYSRNKHYCLGLEFDFQYRLVETKNYIKTKMFIPLIVFYIEKKYNERDFDRIQKLKNEIYNLNPNALLICLTETVDKKMLKSYATIDDCLYIARCCFDNDNPSDLQPQVFLSLYSRIANYVNRELVNFDDIVAAGHMGLVNKTNGG